MSNNKSSKLKVFGNSIFFSCGTIFCKAISFFLIPVYTAYLSPEEYGIGNLLLSFVSSLAIVAILSLRAAVIRFYNEYESDEERRTYLGSIVTFSILSSICFSFLLILTFPIYGDYMLKGISFFPYALLTFLALMFDAVYLIYQSALQARQDGKAYAVNSVIYLLTQIFFNILLCCVLRLGALGMILALLLTNVVFSIVGILSMLKKHLITFTWRWSMIKRSVKYSLPILPHNLANNISTLFSRVFLNNFNSVAMTGIYSLALQITLPLSLIQDSINLAFRPWYNEQMKYGEDGKKNVAEFANLTFTLSCIICVMLGVFSKEIIFIMSDVAFHEAWKVVPIIALANAVGYIYYIYVLGLMYNLKASKYTFMCSLTGSLLNVISCYFLVASHGSFGAAIAYFVGKTVTAMLVILFSQKYVKIKYNLPKMLLKLLFTAIVMCVCVLISYNTPSSISVVELLFKMIISFLFCAIMLFPHRTKMKDVFILCKNKFLKKQRSTK